ncbi:MAG: polysaccharide pyruvyl transferase family protein [Bacteroidales bacterium]|jgi:hypothetical protein|nr:polysaccharide pyruvyl transferase family protein [Bacteroidales bacterium]
MKTGIITYHNALNAGAVLQAYALQTVLQRLGHRVEFINYYPQRKYTVRSFIAKSPFRMWNNWKDIINGIRYSNKGIFGQLLILGEISYNSESELNEHPPIYDLYIAGSDQIWNAFRTVQKFFFLNFAPKGSRKISFAASLGQCKIPDVLHNEIRELLSDFELISVREKNGVDFIQSLLPEKTIYHIQDPTCMLKATDYFSIAEIPNERNYIASYMLALLDKGQNKIINLIKQRLNRKIINLRNPDTCIRLSNAKNSIVTPRQWLGYMINADFVICSSFHAVMFSLIFHKPFIVIQPQLTMEQGGNARIHSLLEPIGLINRCVYGTHDSENNIIEILQKNIDWETVDSYLQNGTENSLNYLKRIL